jgi:uncharacterized protein YukE
VGRTALRRLEALKKDICRGYGLWGIKYLLHSVERAQQEPPPGGSPDEIEEHAAALRAAAHECDQQRNVIRTRVRDRLSGAWTGSAAQRAEASAAALDAGMRRAAEVFAEAAETTYRFASAVGQAQQIDHDGRGHLRYAVALIDGMLGPGPGGYDSATMEHAHHEAMAGISTMLTAAHHLEAASRLVERHFAELSSRARAARIGIAHLSPIEVLLVAAAAVGDGGPPGATPILSANAASRAGEKLYRMNPSDQGSFITLLKAARSPQEQAYLLLALAAGYSRGEIDAFDGKIHGHGADPLWLQQHLTPIGVTTGPDRLHSPRPVEFGGRPWTQGRDPTCVAMSTVMARAEVDPLYALQLTSGGHPDDASHDNGDAFARRLHDEQHHVYDDGRNWLQDLFGADGMTDGQARDVADREVAPHTGLRYHEVTTRSADDRRGVLVEVEQAVDQGLPVTFSVRDHHGGHELAIVGHQDGMLEVYNPWGYTVWVSEDDFVDNHMNAVGDGVPATVHAVNVPRR